MVWHIFQEGTGNYCGVSCSRVLPCFMVLPRSLCSSLASSTRTRCWKCFRMRFRILAFFGSMFLIAAIVHLEAIPGARQDWLTRPIPRGGLLLEKLLFVVITVEGPIFALSLAQGLAFGFSWRSSLLAAAAYVVLLFLLPHPAGIFSFASVTRNMTGGIFVLGCGCTLIMGAFLLLSGLDEINRHTGHL